MPWVETSSPNFAARHELRDEDDVASVLELLEDTRERLVQTFPEPEHEITVVVHGSTGSLALAQPYLPLLQRLTAPASRRYLAGWPGARELHLLAPRRLEARASSVPGSREMALLAPAGLYAQMLVGLANPRLAPPWRPGPTRRTLQWAWLALGAGQYFGGQTAFARPAVGRRLREGDEPSFPPGLRDAALLGGTVLDLLARERGEHAVVELVLGLHEDGPRAALQRAFGRELVHTSGVWRAHLATMGGQA
ncbi:hypothetical protein [Paraconexibacter algicola]|uniref:Uncharacterized protein n=1 Tax=Paraconexibacter algicola TaxID=2133960 RepID=A0A2T4UF39_9ACTN|nr:hypothetical protein [Paraconexibacter algicola]PTL56389.1 hypothetical protein C7Y72_15610 [Paraconexibacter algicola]